MTFFIDLVLILAIAVIGAGFLLWFFNPLIRILANWLEA